MNFAGRTTVWAGLGLVISLLGAAAGASRPDVVIADFEGQDWGGWTATGTAFGPGPAQGTLPGQGPVGGFVGHGLADSFVGGDGATGTLTSPDFAITRRYLCFRIGGGHHPGQTGMALVVHGKIVRTAGGPNGVSGGSEDLHPAFWDLSTLQGKTGHLEIFDRATGGWGHISVDQITLSDAPQGARADDNIDTSKSYHETYRPQFHFTAQKNWLNDPNGLVFDDGEYHLFFQHNPSGLQSGNLSWGHAVSHDLVHWQELPVALHPTPLGPIWSGSAVVDWDSTSRLGAGGKPPLVALYTAAGGTSPESHDQPFTQCLAYSTDRGRTWTQYAHNPVLPHIIGGDRDPKVVWYAPTRHWIMALYLDGSDFALFSSPDLTHWTRIQTLTLPGCDECPDFFPMPIEGQPNDPRWVFTAANGHYWAGTFDGQTFTPEGKIQQVDYGANFYAVQSYSDIPASDGRRIQIAWMRGGDYPGMPFNQQMSFPCALTLHPTPDGLRMRRWPVQEITTLYGHAQQWHDQTLSPGDNPLHKLSGDLWDIDATFAVGPASALGFRVRGEEVRYDVTAQTLSACGRTAPVPLQNGRLSLRLLVDRTSLELFAQNGEVSMTSCFLPPPDNESLAVFAEGGPAHLLSLTVHPLRSAWR